MPNSKPQIPNPKKIPNPKLQVSNLNRINAETQRFTARRSRNRMGIGKKIWGKKI